MNATQTAAQRSVLGMNGRIGEQTQEVSLGLVQADAAVIVASAAAAWYPTTRDRYQRAGQLLLDLPVFRDVPRSERVARMERAGDCLQRADSALVVDGVMQQVHVCREDARTWVALAALQFQTLIVAAEATPLEELSVRTVSDWSAYKVDLRRPQPAAAFSSQTNRPWRGWTSG